MPLINCKVHLKLKWLNYCVLTAAGNDNDNNNDDNGNKFLFAIKDRKLYVPILTLSAKENQKLSKLLSKGFERSVYWNKYKTKNENENTTNEFRYFLESNVVSVNRLFILVYSNQRAYSKRLTLKYCLPKGIIKNYNVILNGENFYDQTIGSEIKLYEEIRKLTTEQAEVYTTGCSLDFEYIKKHYRLIAIDLTRQKELDADPKAIQQIEFVGLLKNPDNEIVANESMSAFKILEKIKETRLNFFRGSVTVL